MYKRVTLFLIIVLAVSSVQAQTNSFPLIGAQVFIEPGQTPQEIDNLFSVMEDCGMKVGRIRMFGSHMQKTDENWDFSLYDAAFESAARHGVKLFATLFPFTDELNDVGGFKFPHSEEHLAEVDEYVKAVVGHFKDKKALECWVLQNEPGSGGPLNPYATPMSRKIYGEFTVGLFDVAESDYLMMPFERERFTRYYTNWYLKHISDVITAIDPVHGRHINPHQILRTLPEYDFTSFEGYLTSLGSSMHASWHFSDFKRHEYPLGVALMSDIIAEAAGDNPWWITEMQGGPVTASGNEILCPSGQETVQTVWSGVFSGTSGVMFWTLNPRKAVREAGEWALMTMNGGRSERLEAVAEQNAVIASNLDFFEGAEPVKSDVYILYNKESFWIQRENANAGKTNAMSRSESAIAASMIGAYKSLSSLGLSPVIQNMECFDFDPSKTVVLPDMVAVTDADVKRLCEFVRQGGTLVSTGMTWYYDAGMRCRFMEYSPLYECLGGRLKEYAIGADVEPLKCRDNTLVTEYWVGLVVPYDDAEVIAYHEGRPVALRNEYGRGISWWFPSMIDIGDRLAESDLAGFYQMACGMGADYDGLKFEKLNPDVFVRILKNRSSYMMLVVNRSSEASAIKMDGMPETPVLIDGEGKISRKRIIVPSDGYVVLKWNSM